MLETFLLSWTQATLSSFPHFFYWQHQTSERTHLTLPGVVSSWEGGGAFPWRAEYWRGQLDSELVSWLTHRSGQDIGKCSSGTLKRTAVLPQGPREALNAPYNGSNIQQQQTVTSSRVKWGEKEVIRGGSKRQLRWPPKGTVMIGWVERGKGNKMSCYSARNNLEDHPYRNYTMYNV